MKFYRIIESLLKKVYKIPNKSRNENLKKAYRSAVFYTSQAKELLYSDHNKINYILKNIIKYKFLIIFFSLSF